MRIGRSFAALVTAATFIAPATAHAGTATGSVLIPGPPTTARVLYLANPATNGVAGFVVDLAGPVADGTSYTLARSGGTGPIQLSAFFYSDLLGSAGQGAVCITRKAEPDSTGGETGTIDCGDSNVDGVENTADNARYAIVTLSAGPDAGGNVSGGADADFTLTWG